MENSLSQTQSLKQEQTLSARQLQSLELLHAPVLELQEQLSQILAANPVLELEPSELELPVGDILSSAERQEKGESEEDFDLTPPPEEWHDELPLPPETGSFDDGGEGREYFFNSLTSERTLHEQLFDELQLASADPVTRRIAELVIGCIDDSGYLRTPPADLAMAADAELPEVMKAVKLVQSFDPPGVGASSPGECLRLQLERRGEKDRRLFELIDRHLDSIERNRLPQVAKAMNIPLDELDRLLGELRKLNPYPGAALSPSSSTFVAVEIEIVRSGDRYVVKPGCRLPRLYISDRYLRMAEDPSLSTEDRQYVKEKINAAREVMRSLEMRESTIRRIGAVIADYQHDFFEKGLEYLRPMTMRQAAELLELHETTVSRAIAGKFVRTPRGVFELRYFFSAGYANAEGETVSSRSVKEQIRLLVEEEDGRKPLSDAKIADLLAEQGLTVARRTVAKYREELGIAPTHLRKIHR